MICDIDILRAYYGVLARIACLCRVCFLHGLFIFFFFRIAMDGWYPAPVYVVRSNEEMFYVGWFYY